MNDDGKISKAGFDFIQIKDINESSKGHSVDFAGVIVQISDKECLKSKKFRKQIVVADESLSSI